MVRDAGDQPWQTPEKEAISSIEASVLTILITWLVIVKLESPRSRSYFSAGAMLSHWSWGIELIVFGSPAFFRKSARLRRNFLFLSHMMRFSMRTVPLPVSL